MDDLTAKQAAFVAAYLETGHIQRAAVAAGYAKSGAHVTGSRLLRNPKIAAKIKAMRQKAENASALSMTEAANILAAIARTSRSEFAKIRAIETAARLLSWEMQQGDVTLRVEYVDPPRTVEPKPKPEPKPEPTPPHAPAPEPKPKPMAKLYTK